MESMQHVEIQSYGWFDYTHGEGFYFLWILFIFNFWNLSQKPQRYQGTTQPGLLGAAKKFTYLPVYTLPGLSMVPYQLLETRFWTLLFLKIERLMLLCSSWGFSSERFLEWWKLNLENQVNIPNSLLIHPLGYKNWTKQVEEVINSFVLSSDK